MTVGITTRKHMTLSIKTVNITTFSITIKNTTLGK